MNSNKKHLPPIDLTRFGTFRLWRAQDGRCFYCNEKMLLAIPPKNGVHPRWHPRLVSRDHFIPKRRGGPLRDNFVFACCKCNSHASDELPSPDEVVRFIQLYQTVKMDYSWVLMKLKEFGIGIELQPPLSSSTILLIT